MTSNILYRIIIVVLITLVLSCRTVKNIETLKLVTDSTAIHQRDSVIQKSRMDSAAYTSMIESLSENTIIFQDTGKTVTKIEYYPDGSLKTVEGNLRSVTAKLSSKAQEAAYWKSKHDSLATHKSKDSVQVKTDIKYVDRQVKRSVFPGWVWIVIIAAALIGLWAGVKYHGKFKT